ncbi:MAG: sugar phosphate isomerase/epimerase family protein [Roseimicrobium sp.]
MKRRVFLKSTAAALPVLGLPITSRGAEPSKCKLLGIGACDWTLKLTAQTASLDLAKRIGLDGVQVDFGSDVQANGKLPLHDEKLQESFLAKASETGVKVPSLALGVLNKIAYKNDANAKQWVLDSVPVAKRMKTPVVLLAFFGNGDLRNDEPGIEAVIAQLKELAPRAEEAGIIYGIESWLKAPVLERMLDAVKSSSIKVYYDVGNMHKEAEDIHAAVRRLGRERICEFHAKDYDDLYGKGSIDFAKVRADMDTIGYTGWMHIEGVKIPNGVEQDIRYDLEHLRKVFA